MKALIFNSGIGKRMGELTHNSPKSMVKLLNNETVFERQIRLLSECGITDFVITTGPFEEQLIDVTKKEAYRHLNFKFVHNDLYDTTNYIYSCYLAREYLDDDLLTLHGDLVFNKKLVIDLLADSRESLCLINKALPKPEKDFKGRIVNGKLREVGINIFDEDCFTFQPLYKLAKADAKVWINSIVDYIENKKISTVYAENAFNDVSSKTNIEVMSYEKYYINEIDNVDDYNKVSKDIQQIDYKQQDIRHNVSELKQIAKQYHLKNPLVVIDAYWAKDSKLIDNVFKSVWKDSFVLFDKFKPNPLYEDVVSGINLFKAKKCDSIISLGGGSAIDTAKAIKLFIPLDETKNYLEQEHKYLNLKHISIPTTAGTGSESTRYAVIYYNLVKQSLTDDMILPDVAILDDSFIHTLPAKQRIATVLDALCHSIESIWSVNATSVSQEYASKAIKMILPNIEAFASLDVSTDRTMLEAANLAGKAINISQTTAAHALSYKLTSLYGVPHGIAVASLLPQVWELLIKSNDKEIKTKLQIISESFGFNKLEDSLSYFKSLLDKLGIYEIVKAKKEDLLTLVNSVNQTRLKNFPIKLSEEQILNVYSKLV